MIKAILYIGDDLEFLQELNIYVKKTLKKNYVIKHRAYRRGIFLKEAEEFQPNVIFLDASSAKVIVEETSLLKTYEKYKPIMLAAICEDLEQANENTFLLASGIHLFHIKGTELDQFFADSFQMAFEEQSSPLKFAKAGELNINLEAGFLSSLSAFSKTHFMVECDLKFDGDLKLKLPFAAGESPLTFKQGKAFSTNLVSPFLEAIEVEFSFPGPWDEITPQTIQEETVETWLGLEERFDCRRSHIKILSNSTSAFSGCFENGDLSCFIDLEFSLNDCISESLSLKMHDIILVEDDEMRDLENFGMLISSIKSIPDYEPLLVVLNNESESSDLRNEHGYEKILVVPERLTSELLLKIITKYCERKNSKNEAQEYFYLKRNDPDRVTSILTDITITSLTEHELTFKSDLTIPMFTVMTFSLPLPFLVTIVPWPQGVGARPKEGHYQGIIHGMNEEGLNKMRKIVNQLIYNPKIKITVESVEKMLKQDYVEKRIPAKDDLHICASKVVGDDFIYDNPNLPAPQLSLATQRLVVTRSFKGKSKL